MRYEPSIHSFLSALLSGRVPTKNDYCLHPKCDPRFKNGYMCAIRLTCRSLGFIEIDNATGSAHLTPDGEAYVWEHSSPAYIELQSFIPSVGD